MKRITIFLLGISLIAPSKASVDKDVHKLCIDSKDYLGCVKANQKFQENKIFTSKTAYYQFKEPKVESFDFSSKRCFDGVGHISERFKNHKTKTCYLKPEAIENYLYGRPIDEHRVHGQFRITNIINPKSGKIEFRDYEQEAINCSKKTSELSLFNSLTKAKNSPWIETGKALERNLKVCPKNPGHFVLLDDVEANFEKMTLVRKELTDS